MAVIQQMLPQGLDPGDLTLWAQSGMIGGVGSPHASASNHASGADIIIAHPYTANKVMMASRNGHMIGNNTVGNPGNNPNPKWTVMAGTTNGGQNWSQSVMTSLNDYDNDGFNTGENGPAGHAMYQNSVSHNDDSSSPRWWMSAGWWPHHDTDPTGSDSHPYLATSTDLFNWSRVKVDRHYDSSVNNSGWINQMVTCGYGNGKLMALNTTTGSINISSNNGSSWGGWTHVSYPFSFVGSNYNSYTHIKHQGGNSNNWLATAYHGNIAWSTNNGSSWSGTTGSYPNYTYYYPRLGNSTSQLERCYFLEYFPTLYGGCWVWMGAKHGGYQNRWAQYPMLMYSTNMSTWTTVLNGKDGSGIGLPSDMRSSAFGSYTSKMIEIDGTYYMWIRRENAVVSNSKPSPYELHASKGDLEHWYKVCDSPFHDSSGTLYNFSEPNMDYSPANKRLYISPVSDGDPVDGCGRVGYIDFL